MSVERFSRVYLSLFVRRCFTMIQLPSSGAMHMEWYSMPLFFNLTRKLNQGKPLSSILQMRTDRPLAINVL